MDDYLSAGLSSRRLAMLDYAVKLTNTPETMEQADVVLLKDAGFTNEEILDICQVAAYFNYVNRLADGLGVELESYWDES